MTFSPKCRNCLITAPASFFTGSETARRPATCELITMPATVFPSCRKGFAAFLKSFSSSLGTSCFSRKASFPRATDLLPTVPCTPNPGVDIKFSVFLCTTRLRSWAAWQIAVASGCSLPTSIVAASDRTSSSD